MDLHEALYTTRAMRRVKPDPIPMDVQERILDAAVRAPSGGNTQDWRFMLVDDRDLLAGLGPMYRDCIDILWTGFYADRLAAAAEDPDSDESKQWTRIKNSVDDAATSFEKYPLLLFAFSKGDPTGGSIFPAVWSAMLAARAEGVGSSLTSVLLFKGDEVPNLLGVPSGEGWQMNCCVPMGYPTGRWGVAKRTPAHDVSYRNGWGNDVGFEIPDPLWPR
ncbi:MAG TPA: nitroreductase family protein [Acidimicrobiales bacterium]|nr:nitroreductase family protein [Acidimicrobiales bacterium]